jgi:hypothetical protein
MENLITAPENRTLFLNKQTLYYNDNGKKTLDKKGLNGVCIINCGGRVTIQDGRIVNISYIQDFLDKNIDLNGKTIQDIKNVLEAFSYHLGVIVNFNENSEYIIHSYDQFWGPIGFVDDKTTIPVRILGLYYKGIKYYF